VRRCAGAAFVGSDINLEADVEEREYARCQGKLSGRQCRRFELRYILCFTAWEVTRACKEQKVKASRTHFIEQSEIVEGRARRAGVPVIVFCREK
jgi:hypothetical protein